MIITIITRPLKQHNLHGIVGNLVKLVGRQKNFSSTPLNPIDRSVKMRHISHNRGGTTFVFWRSLSHANDRAAGTKNRTRLDLADRLVPK